MAGLLSITPHFSARLKMYLTKAIIGFFFYNQKCLASCRSMNYIYDMEFEWDFDKSNRCYVERGFDFAYAAQGFFDPDRIVMKDSRYEY